MKRFVLFLFGIFMCTFAIAETITINWLNEDQTVNQTTTCTVGGDVILPTSPAKRGYTFQGWYANYVPIEYLESTGTQWIDTGIVANETTEAEIEFSDYSVDGGYLFFVSTGLWYSENFGIIINDYIRFYMNCDGKTTYARNPGTTISGNIKLLLTGIFFNNQPLSMSMGATPSTSKFTTTYTIPIFNANLSGSISASSIPYKLKYFKLWQNGVLIRDFIPVLDKNGVPCMYDKVEGKFYYNQGTGQFIAGPAI